MIPNNPVEFHIDYPHQHRDRTRTFFRAFMGLPMLVVLAALAALAALGGSVIGGTNGGGPLFFSGLANGLVVIPPLLTFVLRGKYPHWRFDFNLAFLRFDNRVLGYLLLTSDEYPSTDDEQSIHLDLSYPDVRADLNRWMPLVK